MLGNCKSLSSIQALNGLNALVKLKIDSCPNIGDFASLNNLPSLVELELTNCKEIPSLSFIENLNSLRRLQLLGSTNIVDGNLIPAKDKELSFAPRNHYNVNLENRNHDNLMKNNLKKIMKGFSSDKS